MAYTPTEWETGDVITAEKLNKAEEGIAAASALVCSIEFTSATTATIDEDYGDIVAAIRAGRSVIFMNDDMENGVISYFTLIQALDEYQPAPNTVKLSGFYNGSSMEFDFVEADGVLTWSEPA